jgi:hypothetical protein
VSSVSEELWRQKVLEELEATNRLLTQLLAQALPPHPTVEQMLGNYDPEEDA